MVCGFVANDGSKIGQANVITKLFGKKIAIIFALPRMALILQVFQSLVGLCYFGPKGPKYESI
jgi:hypothetical protein